jgi:hypothetical protein
MKALILLVLVILLAGCVAGESAKRVDPVMTKEQVASIMGRPDGYRKDGDYEITKYRNRLISVWSGDITDHTFTFRDGELVEYEAGEVRERDADGFFPTVFLHSD